MFSAFYILNDWVRFVFASDSELDRSKWMNKLGLAAIGISSTVPTSRIGGFNPGYILAKRSEELKNQRPPTYSNAAALPPQPNNHNNLNLKSRQKHFSTVDSSFFNAIQNGVC